MSHKFLNNPCEPTWIVIYFFPKKNRIKANSDLFWLWHKLVFVFSSDHHIQKPLTSTFFREPPSGWGSSREWNAKEKSPPNKYKCRLKTLLMMKAVWNSSSQSHACMNFFTGIMCVCRDDNDGPSVQEDMTQLLDSGQSETGPNQHLTGLRTTGRSGWCSLSSVIDIILTAWMNISWSSLMFSLCVLSPVYTSALP